MTRSRPGRLDHLTFGDPSRPALTLLHAGGLTHAEWATFAPRFAEYFHVVTPTALGHGASPRVERLDLESLALAVVDLWDDLGIERSHLLGSSMGGATALFLALHHPRRIDRLVLYRTSFRTTRTGSAALEAMTRPETWRQWGMEAEMREQHRPQGGPKAWMEVTRRVIDMVRAEKDERLGRIDALAAITAPTLIICGDRDPLVPLADAVLMYETLPDAALWVVPDATHVLQVESLRRDSFGSEVLAFLRRERS